MSTPEATLTTNPHDGLFSVALACLLERDPEAKRRLTRQAAADWRAGRLALDETCPVAPLTEPGRPAPLVMGVEGSEPVLSVMPALVLCRSAKVQRLSPVQRHRAVRHP